MISCLGKLYTLKRTNSDEDEKLRSVCPECPQPDSFLNQKLHCQQGHGPFVQGDVRWGKQTGDGTIVTVDKATLDEARQSVLPEKELELQVHNREEVEKHTFPSGNSYLFRPEGRGAILYGILVDLLEQRRDLCLVAKTNLRNRDHIVMVDSALNGQLIVRFMIWPEDMKTFEESDRVYDQKQFNQALQLLEVSLEPFDPGEYRKDSRARIAQVVDDATGKTPVKRKTAKKPTDGDALTLALEAALDSKKKRKAS